MAEVRRNLFPGEVEYFKKNPHVSGMAAEDGSVILNPNSKLSDKERKSVIQNESSRIFMKNKEHKPSFKITDQQRESFKNYGTEQDIKETIAARILSGDPSAGISTEEQQNFAKELGRKMKSKYQRYNDINKAGPGEMP